MLVKQANSFKSIDDIFQNSKDTAIQTQLFQKKVKMLQLVQNGKLTADKYLLMCKKIIAETTIQQIKDSTDMELISLDDNVASWFKDVIDETKDKMQDQKKILGKQSSKTQAKKQVQVTPQPKMQKKPSAATTNETALRDSRKPTEQTKSNVQSIIDPTKIFSLKVLDSLMDQNSSSKKMFMSLYQQKQKLLQIINDKKLNAQSYYQTLQKSIRSTNNDDITLSLQMQLDQLKDFHSGNVQSWFKDRIQQTSQQKQKQKQKYSIFKSGKALVPKKQSNDDIDPDVQSMTAKITEKVKKANINTSQYQMSFRYLDQQLEKYQSDQKKYCQLFEQKIKLLQKIKTGQIDAQGYRDMLQSLTQSQRNQQLSQAAKMEIDLHDLTGDVNEFFEGSINQTGEKYQEQQKRYNSFKGGKGQKLKLNKDSISSIQKQIQVVKQVKPQISDIVSFRVLVQFLQKYRKDYDYCVELKQKGSKLMKLVDQKKLGQPQYVKFLQNKIETAKDKQTVAIMKKQLNVFKQSNDPSKQFRSIVTQYLNKTKISLGNRASYDSQIQINEMTIDTADKKTKIQYLIRKLSKYQSLLAFYKNNKLQNHLNQFNKQYQVAKKKTMVLCEKLKNSDAANVDLHAFVDQNLPPISFAVLHRQSKSSYNQKIAAIIQKLKKSNAKIAQYTKALKKGSNKNNIQEGGKMIQKNNKMISYLQSLKTQDLIPFPGVQETKTQMYNLDLNKNLTENEIQIIVRNFQGIKQAITFQIFMIDRKSPRFSATVSNGPQNKIDVIIKIPPQIMEDIIKGSQKKYLNFRLVSKGWFSQKIVADADLQLNFIRTNRMEDRMALKQQKIFMDYVINVLKPKKPLVTEIPTIKLTQYPKYEDNKFVQKQFIKTIMPFQKPTESQIAS